MQRRNDKNWEIYEKQITFCVNLLRRTEAKYFKDPPDNCKFWKTIKPYFSNKGLNLNKLLLKEKVIFFLPFFQRIKNYHSL